MSYMLIYNFEFGYIGAAIAHSITNFVAALGLTLLLIFKSGIVHPDSFHFINKDSFTGWKEYWRYGIPSMMITTLQWASFELMGIYSGILGVTHLGAQTAIANLDGFCHMIPLGTSFGSGAWVGHSLGRGEYKVAQKYSFASYYIAWVEGIFLATVLFFFNDFIFRLYTQNEEILSLMHDVLYILMFGEINSCLLGILKGLIKAMGRQTELAKWSILINVFLSNGFIMIFWFILDLGLPGIWLGLSLAFTIGNAYFSYRVIVADWKVEAQNTLNRIQEDRNKLLTKK